MFTYTLRGRVQMPLSISIIKGEKSETEAVDRSKVIQWAQKLKCPNPMKALAITVPNLRIEPLLFQYDERVTFKPKSSPKEFRFRDGILRLTLRQFVYVAKDLSDCAQKIWLEHENKHVEENRRVMSNMESRIRADTALDAILFTPQWRPDTKQSQEAMHATIKEKISNIFWELGIEAVKTVDTPAEYIRIENKIFRTCPERYYHEVKRGDTLSKLALRYYGQYRHWQQIYNVNKKTIGRDPDLIYPKQRLLIPKIP